MEVFFEITDKDWIEKKEQYERDKSRLDKAVNKIQNEFDINFTSYDVRSDYLVVHFAEKESLYKVIDQVLKNRYPRTFKLKSKVGKRYSHLTDGLYLCKPSCLVFIASSSLGVNSYQYSAFKSQGKWYGYIRSSNQREIKLNDQVKEIPGSKFYEILEKERG